VLLREHVGASATDSSSSPASVTGRLTQSCPLPPCRPHLPWPMRVRSLVPPRTQGGSPPVRGVLAAPLRRRGPARTRILARETRLPSPGRVSRAPFWCPRAGPALPTRIPGCASSPSRSRRRHDPVCGRLRKLSGRDCGHSISRGPPAPASAVLGVDDADSPPATRAANSKPDGNPPPTPAIRRTTIAPNMLRARIPSPITIHMAQVPRAPRLTTRVDFVCWRTRSALRPCDQTTKRSLGR